MLVNGVKKTSTAYNRAVDNVVAIYTKEEKMISPDNFQSNRIASESKGVDVSTIQGVIDWSEVNVDFAMIKATQGQGESASTRLLKRFTDSRFMYNITHCQCERGVYHYLTAQTKEAAIEEIDYFCNAIKPYKAHINLWAAVDVESKYLDGISKAELTAIVKTALDRVAYHGFKPMLYTNPSFLKYRFEPNAFDNYPIWLAHWGVKTPLSVPNLQIWQYGTTTVPGIAKACDGNIGYFGTAKNEATNLYKVGGKYTIKATDKYTTGKAVPASIVGKQYTISKINNTQTAILLKEINSWVKI